jgi:hypothetical protein
MKTILILALAASAFLLNSCASTKSEQDTMPGMSQQDHANMKM